jgi:hypothetical protein
LLKRALIVYFTIRCIWVNTDQWIYYHFIAPSFCHASSMQFSNLLE